MYSLETSQANAFKMCNLCLGGGLLLLMAFVWWQWGYFRLAATVIKILCYIWPLEHARVSSVPERNTFDAWSLGIAGLGCFDKVVNVTGSSSFHRSQLLLFKVTSSSPAAVGSVVGVICVALTSGCNRGLSKGHMLHCLSWKPRLDGWIAAILFLLLVQDHSILNERTCGLSNTTLKVVLHLLTPPCVALRAIQ